MATRQYIGARYVPKFYTNSVDGSTQWEANVVYEPLTYVTLTNGHMYISKKQVPATIGTPASNVDYWLDIGSYNGFIEQLQGEIDTINNTTIPALSQNMQAQINSVKKSVDPIDFDIIVAKDGTGDYTTLTAAVAAATTGQRIFVKKGYYDEEVVNAQSKTLTIIGEDPEATTITNAYNDYARCPIMIASGFVQNLKFVSRGTGGSSPAYGAHVDYESMANNRLTFDSCYFESVTTYAVGAGTRNHGQLIFKDCVMIGSSGSYGALFIHSSTNSSAYGSDQQCILINTRLYAISRAVVAVQSVGTSENNLYITFLGCMLNTSSGYKDGLIFKTAVSGATGEVVFMAGAGNNYGLLNEDEYSDGTCVIGRKGNKCVKKYIFRGTLDGTNDANKALPSDCEEVLECHVLIKESAGLLWTPAGCTVPGTGRSSETFFVNETGNKSIVIHGSAAGSYIGTIVYVSSATTDL